MAKSAWFETVAEAQRRAKKRLPKSVYAALVAGSERGLTIDDNMAAFGELGFAPHVAGLSDKRDLSTTVMGQSLSFPVMISPTGVQAVHPDGEVAVARAAAARGIPIGLSSFASKSVEEVAAANPQTFFQMYWVGSREVLLQRMERARAAGAVGLIMTLDWSFSNGRDWGSPSIPEKMDLKAMAAFAPEGIMRPKWLWEFAKTGKIPDLTTPNLTPPTGGPAPTFFGAYGEWMGTPLRRGRTWRGCVSSGVDRSCSRASCVSTTPRRQSMQVSRPSRCPITEATISTGPRPRSGRCPRSRRLSAIRSRSPSTAEYGVAVTL